MLEEKRGGQALRPDGQPDERGGQVDNPHDNENTQQDRDDHTNANRVFTFFPPRGGIGQKPGHRRYYFFPAVHLNSTSFKFVLLT